MELWHIRGGNRLEGVYTVQGSKNASLPILAATVVAPMRCRLHRVPQLSDVDAALRILRHLGCRAEQSGPDVYIDSTGLSGCCIPHELMEQMRSSVVFMGALLARCGEAMLSLPGGCRLGKRPVDLHLAALRSLGAVIEEDGTELRCRPSALHAARIQLPFPSVGATENAMLAACRCRGETWIHGAAREPEIAALQAFLNAAGAHVSGAGSPCIRVAGGRMQRSLACRIPPDRIAASTFVCAAAATEGTVEVRGIDAGQISALLHFLNEAGCDIINNNRAFCVRARGRLRALGEVETAPYPGFPTDAQPLLMAALLRSQGETRIRDAIFENRFRQVPELRRLGADISSGAQSALVRGVERLHGAALTATDLRGGAAMVLAGLCAEGETVVFDEGHIARGYERLDESLRALGAQVYLEC